MLFHLLESEDYRDVADTGSRAKPRNPERLSPLLTLLTEETPSFSSMLAHQEKAQRVFPERMFLYFGRLYEKYRIPIYPVAILSYKAPKSAAPESFEIEFPGKSVLKFNYTVIQLNRLRWRDFLDNHNPVATALMAQMQVAAEDRRTVTLECLRLLATSKLDPAKSRIIGVFIESYLKLTSEENTLFEQELSQLSAAERDATMEMMTSWHKAGWREGLREGLSEGRSEGRTEGLREGQLMEGRRILLSIGRMRLGEPGDSVKEVINKIASPDEIEAMIARVLNVDSWDQLL